MPESLCCQVNPLLYGGCAHCGRRYCDDCYKILRISSTFKRPLRSGSGGSDYICIDCRYPISQLQYDVGMKIWEDPYKKNGDPFNSIMKREMGHNRKKRWSKRQRYHEWEKLVKEGKIIWI